MMRHVLRMAVTVSLCTIVFASVAWGVLAVWFDGPDSRTLAGSMAAGLPLISVLLAAFVRPFLRGLVAALLPVVAVALWWASIPASNTRDWSPDVARTARVTFHGSFVTIQNLRNFKYRSETDYEQRWETRTYNLDQIRGLDLFLSFWGPTQVAHTIASWEFEDGRDLAISIETRKSKGQNCTTTIRGHAQDVGVGGPLDWRILVNGNVDQLLYERGRIDTDLPFAELRKRSNITEKAKAVDESPDFSARIRQGLPETH